MTGSFLHLVPGGLRDEDTDQVQRLEAFTGRHAGAVYFRPSDDDHPWELRVPEPDGYRTLFGWTVRGLMDKADKHYPAAGGAAQDG